MPKLRKSRSPAVRSCRRRTVRPRRFHDIVNIPHFVNIVRVTYVREARRTASQNRRCNHVFESQP